MGGKGVRSKNDGKSGESENWRVKAMKTGRNGEKIGVDLGYPTQHEKRQSWNCR